MKRNLSTSKKKRILNPNSLANLKPAKPGETHNPGGRPKGSITISERIKRYIFDPKNEVEVQKIVNNLMKRSLEENYSLGVVMERTEGKVPDKKEHSGTINLVVEYRDDKPVDEDAAYDSQVNI